jgi:hypothetical protein
MKNFSVILFNYHELLITPMPGTGTTRDLICMGGMIFLLHDSKIDVKCTEGSFWDGPIHGRGLM